MSIYSVNEYCMKSSMPNTKRYKDDPCSPTGENRHEQTAKK